MTLFGVKLQTKREFLIKESNVLTVSDVVDQDGNIRSRQVTVRTVYKSSAIVKTLADPFCLPHQLRPFDPASQTYPDNALLQWDSFINGVTHIMTRWHL
jgi:hypothetical protein